MVSIIIPVFNAERYLEECIMSILGQTYRDFEIILINDGSTDRSSQICRELSDKYSQIEVIEQVNQGVNQARKIGFTNSSGEWVMFVDSDDILPKHSIESLLKSSSGYDIVSGTFRFIDEKGQILNKWGPINEKHEGHSFRFVSDLLIDKRWKCLWRQLIRRECIKAEFFDTDTRLKIAEDYLVMLQVGLGIKNYIGIEKDVYHYRWYSQSSVHKYKPSLEHFELLSESILNAFHNRKEQFINQIVKSLSTLYFEHCDLRGINNTVGAKFLRTSFFYSECLLKRDRLKLLLLFIPSCRVRKSIVKLIG